MVSALGELGARFLSETEYVDPHCHFKHVAALGASIVNRNRRPKMDNRLTNYYVQGGGRAVWTTTFTSKINAAEPAERARLTLRCAAAVQVPLEVLLHSGMGDRLDLTACPYTKVVAQVLGRTALPFHLGLPKQAPSLELAHHPEDKRVGVLTVSTPHLVGVQPDVKMGVRGRGEQHLSTVTRRVGVRTVDTFAVHLPAFERRLGDLDLGDNPAAITALLGLKIIGARDTSIIAPVATVVNMVQLF
jgi:hypothetical protein